MRGAVCKTRCRVLQQRSLPAFAAQSFRQWFAARGVRHQDGRPVVLWADTFNNHFHPETAMAATDVLEAQGCRVVDSGCCGLAGAFGFDRHHYDVSMAVGERVLLPAVHSAAPETLVIADGFSCREQIVHGTGRRALHLAEVIRLAMAEEREEEPPDAAPAPIADPAPVVALGLTAAGLALAGVFGRRALARHSRRTNV